MKYPARFFLRSLIVFLFFFLWVASTPQLLGQTQFRSEIDTLYYLPAYTTFSTNYAIAGEIYSPHSKFKPQNGWDSYKVKEIHYLFSHMVTNDTLEKIELYKDTMQTKIYEQPINDVLDSSDVFPNWYKVIIDSTLTSHQGEIEVPFRSMGLFDLCAPNNITSMSGNSIGFNESSQSWIPIMDFPIKLIIERTSTDLPHELDKVYKYSLSQNYPNPFNPSTTITVTVKEEGIVNLVLYDILGNQVKTLVNRKMERGKHDIHFEAGELSSGIYLYRLHVNNFIETKKLILLK